MHSILYMFRAAMCPSSGELNVSIRHLIYIFSWWWAHGCPKHAQNRNKHTWKRIVRQIGHLQGLFINCKWQPISCLPITVTYHYTNTTDKFTFKFQKNGEILDRLYFTSVLLMRPNHSNVMLFSISAPSILHRTISDAAQLQVLNLSHFSLQFN